MLGNKNPKNEIRTDEFTFSDGICPLILWILISIAFILVALFEYFLILVLLRFGNKVGSYSPSNCLEVYRAILLYLQKSFFFARLLKK